MDPTQVLKELERREKQGVFKKLISFASPRNFQIDVEDLEKWDAILIFILKFLCDDHNESLKECAQLSSHTFFSLLAALHTQEDAKDFLVKCLKLDNNEIIFRGKTCKVKLNRDLFKLTIIYGFLLVNKPQLYDGKTLQIMFDIIYENSTRYTEYTYCAYKILYIWLQRIYANAICLEEHFEVYETKLEGLIFSNWHNAIHELSRQNSTLIFNMYLKIMGNKYKRFNFFFHHCLNLSWNNEVKYIILSEICNVQSNIYEMISEDFLLGLCISLTKNYLYHAGTKVYTTILKNLPVEEWQELVGPVIKLIIEHWEAKGEQDHIQAFCKHWLEPTVSKYDNILPSLWQMSKETGSVLFQSHLQRIASEICVELPDKSNVLQYVHHENETIRLNGYATYCNEIAYFSNIDKENPFIIMKRFLWYNSNTTSVSMREEILKHFKVFYTNLLKLVDIDRDYYYGHLHSFILWFYKYLLDCFDIGAGYQRKILGLKLYHNFILVTLQLTCTDEEILELKCPDTKQYLVKKILLRTNTFIFIQEVFFLTLCRLVLDTASDISELAADAIINYIDPETVPDNDKKELFWIAWRHCNSSKFYEIECGAILMKIFHYWDVRVPKHFYKELVNDRPYKDKLVEHNPGYSNCKRSTWGYIEFLYYEACYQFECLRKGILNAIINGTPFYGVLTALLKIITSKICPTRSSDHICIFFAKTITLVNDAVDYLLAVLSSKSENTECSSSFEEMGLLIDEMIKESEIDKDCNWDELNLSPAHQTIVSCIWMSLKICCELANKIGVNWKSSNKVKLPFDLLVRVLTKCRHKGVIEAAGNAIGDLSSHLIDTEFSHLPKQCLVDLLENESMATPNITRRGAGLSIMFHKIVTGGAGRGKYLLQYAVPKLLNLLRELPESYTIDMDCNHDLLFARHLHYLSTLMADKKVNALLVQYTEEVALLCMKYLQSEIWPIRNASLRLFSAVEPKLVGSNTAKKQPDFGTGNSVYHFIAYYPNLTNYILTELEKHSNISSQTLLHVPSNLIQILTILSKLSVTGCDFVDHTSKEFVISVQTNLTNLLGNPIFYIRSLAAKAYAALTMPSLILTRMEQFKSQLIAISNMNSTHGRLLAVKYLREKYSIETENVLTELSSTKPPKPVSLESNLEVLDRIQRILQEWHTGNNERFTDYVLQTLLLQLSELEDEFLPALPENPVIPERALLSEQTRPGFFLFLDTLMNLYSKRFSLNKTEEQVNTSLSLLNSILNSPSTDQIVFFLNHFSNNSNAANYLERILEKFANNLEDLEQSLLNALTTCITKNHIIYLKGNQNIKNFMSSRNFEDLKMRSADLTNPRRRLSLDNLDKRNQNSKNLVRRKSDGNLTTNVLKHSEGNSTRTDVIHLKRLLILLFHNERESRDSILSEVIRTVDDKEELTRRRAAECVKCAIGTGNISTILLLHCVLILLKDEVIEIRESISESVRKHMDSICQFIFDDKNVPIHEEILYENLTRELVVHHRCTEDRNAVEIVYFLKKFPEIKNREVNLVLENPFDHDEDCKDSSRFWTVLYYCFFTEMQSKVSNCFSDSSCALELKDTISERIIDPSDTKMFLNADKNGYLSKKREIIADFCYCGISCVM